MNGLLATPPVAIARFSRDGRCTYKNGQWDSRMDAEAWLPEALQAAFAGRRVEHLGMHAEPLHGSDGVVSEVLVVASSASASAAALRAVIDLAPIPIFARDRQGRFLLANVASAANMRTTPDKVEGRTFEEITGSPDTDEVRADYERIFATGQPNPEKEITVELGERRHTVWRVMRLPMVVQGEVVAAMGVAVDLTEVRQAERELRVANDRYRQQFDLAPEAILIVDLGKKKLIDCNKATLQLYGATFEQLTTLPPETFSSGRPMEGVDREELSRQWVARALAGEQPSMDWWIKRLDGTEVPVEVRMTRFASADSALMRISFIDLTERRRAEALRAQAALLEGQYQRIQEASRLKSSFLANMSHELRTPLNAIIGFAEILHGGLVPVDGREHKEFLGDILSSGRHLLQLTNDILDLSRIEAGRIEFDPAEVDPVELAHNVINTLRVVAENKHVQVLAEFDPDLGTVVIDAQRFTQVLFNYLSNALKFTPEGGTVRVRLRPREEDRFWLSVVDTGIGISREDLGKLFTEFHQAERGAGKRYPGAGLGLALTRRLVEAQGGEIGVHSRLGHGSEFYAILPRRPRSAAEVHRARTVLVIDDDPAETEAVGRCLADAGFHVEVATSAADAIHRVGANRYDAIVLGLLVVGGGHEDVIAALRTASVRHDVPIVLVTMTAHEALAGFAIDEVIAKPVDPEALLAALGRAGLERNVTSGVLVVDDDPLSLRLMDAALSNAGLAPICRSDGGSGLLAVKKFAPVAIVLDLLMPGMDGFEFLARLRADPEHADTAVIVWTCHELSVADRDRLRRSAAALVPKQGDVGQLLGELRAILGRRATR